MKSTEVEKLFKDLGVKFDDKVAEYVTFITNKDTLKWIDEYLQNSHGHHTYKLELGDVFAVDPPDNSKFIRDSNHKLLWHGTARSNVFPILKEGYKIGRTGCMFGPGIYFADCSSKSANYCYLERNLATTNLTETLTGWMFLSEIALGQSYDYLQAEYLAHQICEKNGRGSVRGKGQWQPDFFVQYFLEGIEPFVHVPLGKLKMLARDTSLQYNEYVIYNPKRVRHRYLLQIKFVPANKKSS